MNAQQFGDGTVHKLPADFRKAIQLDIAAASLWADITPLARNEWAGGLPRLLAIVGYTLFGLGLAFYATPSTDAALSSLPMAQSGSGAGIYKMAPSLGAALGVAISGAIFTGLGPSGSGVQWLEGVITFQGRSDNLAIREAAMVALGFNLLMVMVAIGSILLTIPAGKREK
ncbi:MAG TPA: hypothetical protein PL007_04845 [Thermomonas sp.]|jgi:DHA2 family multidrug resistance protein-like MFS transporter|nr:hypothetical protein [Thermomonas sp.]